MPGIVTCILRRKQCLSLALMKAPSGRAHLLQGIHFGCNSNSTTNRIHFETGNLVERLHLPKAQPVELLLLVDVVHIPQNDQKSDA
jgi:hypothetical protein